MAWEDILESWRNSIPTEERFNKVRSVIKNVFEKANWVSGTHYKVEDRRLLFYKKKIRPEDTKVAPDGSFQIIVHDNKVIGLYIKRLLFMIDIIEAYERTRP